MKTLTKTLITSTFILLTTGAAYASSLEAANNSKTTQICIAAAEGNKARLHIKIKESGLSKVFVANNVKCNDQDITSFVAIHGKDPVTINSILNKYRKDKNISQVNLAKR